MNREARQKISTADKKTDSLFVRFVACAVILCICAAARYGGFFEAQLDALSGKISENADFSVLKKRLTGEEKPFLAPVSGVITTGFCNEHPGVDIAADKGTVVLSSAEGYVAEACVNGGYGNCVQIIHPDGTLTLYAHLDSFSVKSGDRVKCGAEIGRVGSTGDSTGPHLHFEIQQNGVHLDPSAETEGL